MYDFFLHINLYWSDRIHLIDDSFIAYAKTTRFSSYASEKYVHLIPDLKLHFNFWSLIMLNKTLSSLPDSLVLAAARISRIRWAAFSTILEAHESSVSISEDGTSMTSSFSLVIWLNSMKPSLFIGLNLMVTLTLRLLQHSYARTSKNKLIISSNLIFQTIWATMVTAEILTSISNKKLY